MEAIGNLDTERESERGRERKEGEQEVKRTFYHRLVSICREETSNNQAIKQ